MNKKKYSNEEIFEEIEIESSRIKQSDLNEIITDQDKIDNKSSKIDIGRFKKLINQIKLAISLIKDFKARKYTDIPWRSIALIATAVLYFVNPFDIVPDMLPLFGITDDAFLFASVFKSIQVDLEKYCHWKGLDPDKYF